MRRQATGAGHSPSLDHRPELAAEKAKNGTHHCQFAHPAIPRPELAAEKAKSGTHHCQFAAVSEEGQ